MKKDFGSGTYQRTSESDGQQVLAENFQTEMMPRTQDQLNILGTAPYP